MPYTPRPTTRGGVRTGEPLTASQTDRGESARDAKRGPGRPKGSKNKPKSALPVETANAILLSMRDALPPEHFEYMKSVVRDGKSVSTKNELAILILLLSRNLYPALVMESMQPSEPESNASEFFEEDDGDDAPARKETGLKMPAFRKDVTDRLKVLQSLLALHERIERGDKDADTGQDTILHITAKRGIEPGRLLALVGIEPGAMAGNTNAIEVVSNDPRVVSDKDAER